jgi:hypothetical protein
VCRLQKRTAQLQKYFLESHAIELSNISGCLANVAKLTPQFTSVAFRHQKHILTQAIKTDHTTCSSLHKHNFFLICGFHV